jgi:F0F1-type ATP synthase assembly protein I
MNNLSILNIGAWGFTMAISGILFSYIGRQMDVFFSTEPQFMIGLMLLAIFLCVGKLYKEANDKSKSSF